MNKKLAKFNFILTSILLFLALVLCFAQFNLPGSNKKFNGFFNSINATSEFVNGNSAVYKIVSEEVDDDKIINTVDKIRLILDDEGFVNSKVYRQGDFIRTEIEAKDNSKSILDIIGNSKSFFISSKDQETITLEELNSYDIVGEDIKDAYYTTQFQFNKEINGITIKFNNVGSDKLEELTTQVSVTTESSVYFYVDGTKTTSLKVEKTTNGELSFYSENYSQETAQNFALQIKMASTGVQLKVISNSTTTATLGKNVLLLTMIAVLIALAIVMVFLPLIYGDFGLLADMSILVGAVLGIFLLQALPFTTGSIATVFGVIAGIGIQTLCHIIYLNKIKSEFKYMQKFKLAVKTGFKKSWLKNLDICALTFLGSVSLAFWNIPFISTFAIGLATMTFVALITTIVTLRDFVTWYININPKNFKRVKFTKGENND